MSTSVVVWEWEDFPNLWIPYNVEVCEFIEGHYQSSPRLSCLNLGDADLNLMFYDINLIRLIQTRQETGRERKIRRQLYPANWPPGQGTMWQWWNDVTWVFYDIPSCRELEEAFQSKKAKVYLTALMPLNLHIAVDITDKKLMTQVNLETKFKREVQRITCRPYPCHVPSNFVPIQRTRSSINTGISQSPDAAGSFPNTSSAHTTNHCHKKKKKLDLTNRVDACYSHKNKDKDTDSLSMFCSGVDTPPNEECSICFEKLADEPGFKNSNETFMHQVKKLDKCDHMFHSSCLLSMYQSGNKDGSLQCPTCKVIHGVKKGIQPDTGTMSVHKSHDSLPGHPGSGMITITYDFRPGIQGPEHPSPGKRFSVRGFPRVCYIPDSIKGRKVLRLLKVAWDRRLTFTVGSSSTTGEQGTVVWNEIHHKTESFSNHSGHGYPDPNYLDNVLAELAAHGVTEEDS